MNHPSPLEAIFFAALEKGTPEERAAYLDEACEGDPDVRRRVEKMLAAQAQASRFLEEPACGPAATIDQPTLERPGMQIGPYKLLEQIGEGGFGVVFLAEQTEPVRRKVAIKVLKPGMDTRQVVARFEAERQALALMDHPNIAKVLDAGAVGVPASAGIAEVLASAGSSQSEDCLKAGHQQGRPYFVMELVKGVPITEFCDQHHFTPRERLELFTHVCHAAQHAHQKGIIHRDIKPTNVLVASHDGKPVVKVIDFGVAKAAGRVLTDKTLVTGFGNIVGTLEYMSPEQAEVNQLDIDTRSDIYSLGVLLYELLTGSPPFTRKELEKSGMLEMLRVIREQEPSKPSTKLSTDERLPTLAANRGTEPAKLTKLVRGELDWIVMKALEKDRARRYETANSFAMDVQRYLADEPVEAGPPSRMYRLRKFLRRHRGPVLAASVMILLLVAGIFGTTIGLVRAERRAEGERQAKEIAQTRLERIEEAIVILSSVFENLDPRAEEKEGKPLRAILGDRLMQAANQLEREGIQEPVVVAELQNRLGQSLLNLGMAKEAIEVLEKARQTRARLLGADHADTLDTMSHLAVSHKYAGNVTKAIELQSETLALRKVALGPDHPDTLTSMNNLGAVYRENGKVKLALPLHEEALRLRREKLGPTHVDTLVSMNNLAMSYHVDGQMDRAIPLYEETLRLRKETLGPAHASTQTSMNNLALGYKNVGKLELALPLMEETLKLRKAGLGATHPDTLIAMNNLASALKDSGRAEEAVAVHQEVLRIRKEKDPNHPDVLVSMNNLAQSLQAAGQLDQALPLLEETLRLRRASLGPDHPNTINSLNALANGLLAAGKPQEAVPLSEEALKLRKAGQGPEHPDTLRAMSFLALIYQRAQMPDKALPLLEEAARGMEKMGFREENAGIVVNRLVSFQEEQQQYDQAEAWRRKWLAVVKEKAGPESTAYAKELAGLSANLLAQKKHADAEPLLREALAIMQKIAPDDKVLASDVLKRLVELYEAWEKPEEAARWRKELDALEQAKS